MPSEDRKDLAGTRLNGRYRIEGLLGQGSMGEVYRAWDTVLGRDVAVKVLSHHSLDTRGRTPLLHEAQYIAKLNHPNIVTVHDVGDQDGLPFIVMEFVEGETLYQTRPDDLEAIIDIAGDICAALQHAHSHQIIHRDLKPENVLLTAEAGAKLMDFGLARSVASRLTSDGAIVGTVFYLAPEQAMGKTIDGRADLYSLGVMLYELVTGRLPFEAEEALAVISQHLHAAPVRPSTYRPHLSQDFESIILKLLEKNRDDRYADAGALGAALRSLADGSAVEPIDVEAYLAMPSLERLARGRLVGRAKELAELQALWAESNSGHGQLALISGEPGVGKTRLASEMILRAQLNGASVLQGGCYEYEAATPYMPFVEALRDWVREVDAEQLRKYLDSTAPTIAKLAPELEAKVGPQRSLPPLSANEERLRLFDHVARLFRRLANEKGLIVFLDDLHWADQGALHLLHYLLRHLRADRVLFLACYREVELDRAHPLADALVAWNREHLATRISLDRFSMDETEALLMALFQEDTSPPFLHAIHRETEGNPFFIEEVIKALVESGAIYRQGDEWQRVEIEELAIPQSVKEAIGRRLNRLSDACTEVLYVAAALGKQFEFGELAAVVEQEEQALDALDEARQAELVRTVGGETFSFTHDKIREVLYLELNPIRRRRLHKRIGEMMEAKYADEVEGHIQDLAHHFTEAGELEKGYEYSIRATQQAISLYALEQATEIVENAIDCAVGLEDRDKEREAFHLQSQAFGANGRYPQAIEAVQAAIDRTRNPVEAAKMKVTQGGYHTMLSEAEGVDLLTEAIDVLQAEPESPALANAYTMLGRHHHYNAEHRAAVELYHRALEIAERLDDPQALINAIAYLAGANQHLLEIETSNERARRCIELGEKHDLPIGVAVGHEFLAENAYFLGEWDAGLHHGEADVRIGRKHEMLDRVAWGKMALLLSYLGKGEIERAIDAGEEGLSISEDLGEYRLGVWVGAGLAVAYANRGRFEDAHRAADLALERADELRQIPLRTFARAGKATVLWLDGDLQAAYALAKEAAEIDAGSESQVSRTFSRPLELELSVEAGDLERARSRVDSLAEFADRSGSASLQGRAARIRARLAAQDDDHERARQHFAHSILLFEDGGSRPEWGRSLVARGRWLQGQGESEMAKADFRAAAEIFEACGMRPELERVGSLLARMEDSA